MNLSNTSAAMGDNSLHLPFRPRARLLQLLGDELIGSARLAVFELVKNAYDADAETVKVVLTDIDGPEASIVIEDDGDGMTLDVIRDIWLVPGHDHRALQRKDLRRTRKHRLPLGEKGLGRFAAHKLGDRIELVTRAKQAPECVVSIDWETLIHHETLADATVQVFARDPVVFAGSSSGTRIVISKLRERNWTRGEVRRLQRQITSMSSPFRTRSDRFNTILEIPNHEDWIEGILDAESMLRIAPWAFHFQFSRGKFSWKYRFNGVHGIRLDRRILEKEEQILLMHKKRDSDRSDITEVVRESRTIKEVADESTSQGIGSVEGHLYVFDRDPAILKRLGESQFIRLYLDENGGIRVYRDGIRVYNYGEPSEDWLGLDLRRVNSPALRISQNIVVGAIDLSLAESYDLKEKTNREGFVENSALRRLKQIILGALTPFEAERKKDKDSIRALTASGVALETNRVIRPIKKLRVIAWKSEEAKTLGPLIDQVEREYDELRDGMLRAGVSGISLAIVFHEVEQGVRTLCDLIEQGGDRSAIRARAQELAQTLGGFTDLLRKGPRKRNSLNKLVRRVIDINRVRMRKHRVRLCCPVVKEGFPIFKTDFVFGLTLGALNNLFDNAIYWLGVRRPADSSDTKDRKIYVNINPDFSEGLAIIVADTGPGFSDDPEVLTRPFFTRRPEGMGLGLYYANLVMELGNGRLVFPDAKEADVPEEFDGAVVGLIFPREEM